MTNNAGFRGIQESAETAEIRSQIKQEVQLRDGLPLKSDELVKPVTQTIYDRLDLHIIDLSKIDTKPSTRSGTMTMGLMRNRAALSIQHV